MEPTSRTQEPYPWWAGNARFLQLSNTFIVAHVAQAALIMFWAGATTLFELAVYSPEQPMYTQGLILLPHLAAEGWSPIVDGSLVKTFPLFSIGVIHVVAAGVLAAGAYFHWNRLPQGLDQASGRAEKFHFEWDDPARLGLILGHHLLILGGGALLLVFKAMVVGGLYDPHTGIVRTVTSPTLDLATIWDYRTHLFDVDNLEDLVGGHIYVAGILILGGTWHILVRPFSWVQRSFQFNADGILSYSLFGIALAGFAASYFCGFNSLAYPEAFYGPTLQLKSAFTPYFVDPHPTMAVGYTSRTWLANAHFYLAFFFLQGSLWHFWRSLGFQGSSLIRNWQQALVETSENPALAYQRVESVQPTPQLQVQYEMPMFDQGPMLGWAGASAELMYERAGGQEQRFSAMQNSLSSVLYQTRFQAVVDIFYQASEQGNREQNELDRRGGLEDLYDPTRPSARRPNHPQPIAESSSQLSYGLG
ncbi:MAG: chlorophyll a/b binding light-harvesting protein [Synechococcaceae cyanobacterium SM2_3_1]|nr:chlorophyll a/b binding light-harvesting protein [Synechococcaceae cyanobacterium SM2_3_1]